jgi:hypothetical protein
VPKKFSSRGKKKETIEKKKRTVIGNKDHSLYRHLISTGCIQRLFVMDISSK